ncbi:efflux transporter outer membrane subunit [Aurantiacibacter poecillastricola]|uniref:efflux transporter outer membrane subunit n=1 Tax=Aurantiacibacter poecillastricola TaxID=3064385 RepID=UPI00273EF4DC|nr:efflux transporter outer membrane subunit [Aurantiacibacter sp. 219JJ12-13]MDP5261372.1 efflux transporter outer membrane subunit [Aurantiacibacter sp. 219JJ12-13]
MTLLRLSPALMLAATAGCVSLAPEPQTPAVVTGIPETYPSSMEGGDYRPAAWWEGFEDPVLNTLVGRALEGNLDIVQAAARAERAAAQARIARSALFPSVEGSASTSYSNTPVAGGAFANFPGAPTRIVNETYSLGLAAGYELDLFGRVRSDLAAARADAIAAEYDVRAVRLATAAEVISAYFDIVDARYQIATTLRATDVLAERTERTEARYLRGLAQSFELYQVREQLRSAEASLPQREIALTNAEGRLAVLLADYPEALSEQLDQPLLPQLVFDPVPAGFPVELLAQRPDVAASWERLEAARLRIGARRAERFPALRFNVSTGTQAASPAEVFDIGQNWLLSLGSNLVAPIFDGGRIGANIAAARATYDEAAAAYGSAVLAAYQEVTTAIEAYEEQRQRYRLIIAQKAEAEGALDLQARRFRAGVGDYVGYLDALRSYFQVEASLSAAGRDVALARLGVHRALGGDWFGQAGERLTDEGNDGE